MSLWKHLFGRAMESDSFNLPDGTVSLIASPDSTRLIYAVQDSRGAHVEVNGRRLRGYDAVSGITFSSDSRHVAYAAYCDDKWLVVFDEIEYEQWDDIGKTSPVISPDSKHVAYTGKKGNEWFAVLDGNRVGGPYEGFGPGGIVFSPDSQHMVYIVKKDDLWLAVVDGREHKAFPTIAERSWIFSPDSKKVAYVAGIRGARVRQGFVGEESVVIDGEIQQTWKHDETTKRDGISNEIYFSPDSKRVAYGVAQDGKYFFVIDDVLQKKYDGLVSGWAGNPLWSKFPDYGKTFCRSDGIVFSPDSLHFAYAVADRNQHLLIYDGEERSRHQAIVNAPIVFSSDSKRLAYGAEKGSKQFVVVDWKAMEAYDGLPLIEFSFSPDSKHIAYVASKGTNYLLVVDSRSWLMQDGPVIGAKLVWDDPTHLHSLVAKGRKITIARFEV